MNHHFSRRHFLQRTALLLGALTLHSTSFAHTAPDAGSVLIAYFSWSGNTRGIARLLHQKIGGDLVEIRPAVPYSEDYNTCLDQAKRDRETEARPELATQMNDMERYGTVYLGYPNWWAGIPMPVASFLEQYDFAGKTIIPRSSQKPSPYAMAAAVPCPKIWMRGWNGSAWPAEEGLSQTAACRGWRILWRSNDKPGVSQDEHNHAETHRATAESTVMPERRMPRIPPMKQNLLPAGPFLPAGPLKGGTNRQAAISSPSPSYAPHAKALSTLASSSLIAICCGQTCSHLPHRMHSPAFFFPCLSTSQSF